ncbi:hypothetical protein GC163_18615 [bacterium]|nr:hypothetical protein [bacterium]
MALLMASDRKDQRRLERAEGYLMLGMAEQALKELRSIADPTADAYTYHHHRADAFRLLERYAESLDEFQTCQMLQPDEVDVFMGLAWCYKRLGQLAHAIATTHDAVQAHPDEPVLLYNLACYYALSGQKSQALSWLGRALRKAPQLRELIDDETDFNPIRESAEFRKLLELSA